MKDMKTIKRLNHIFWAVAAIILNIMVVYYWGREGCPTKSLVIGCIVYTMFCSVGWWFFHSHYTEIEGGI